MLERAAGITSLTLQKSRSSSLVTVFAIPSVHRFTAVVVVVAVRVKKTRERRGGEDKERASACSSSSKRETKTKGKGVEHCVGRSDGRKKQNKGGQRCSSTQDVLLGFLASLPLAVASEGAAAAATCRRESFLRRRVWVKKERTKNKGKAREVARTHRQPILGTPKNTTTEHASINGQDRKAIPREAIVKGGKSKRKKGGERRGSGGDSGTRR